MQQLPDFLYEFSVMADGATLAAFLIGIGLLVRHNRTAPAKAGYILGFVLLLWFGVTTTLAFDGFFIANSIAKAPAILIAILVPVFGGLALVFRSTTMRMLLEGTPLTWLIGSQLFRVEGGIFLILWSLGGLPWEFALAAGLGDVAIGLLAIPVALGARGGTGFGLSVARIWNYLGILDLLVAVATGFLTSPGPFQILAIGHPNLLVTRYPLVMIPVYFVPFSLILHGLTLWKLGHANRSSEVAVLA